MVSTVRYLVVVLVTASWLLGGEALATVWKFDCVEAGTCPHSNGAGQMTSSTFLFDDQSLDFNWQATFEPTTLGGPTPDGFWMVMGNGPEPIKPDPFTTPPYSIPGLAIIYGDGSSRTAYAYVYSADTGKNSWDDPGILIDTFANSLKFTDLGGGTVGLDFAINVASINSYSADSDWQGLFYQETIGFWVAALSGTTFEFENGEIFAFSYTGRTSYDRTDRTTTEVSVPEPASVALLLAGVLLLRLARRRQA